MQLNFVFGKYRTYTIICYCIHWYARTNGVFVLVWCYYTAAHRGSKTGKKRNRTRNSQHRQSIAMNHNVWNDLNFILTDDGDMINAVMLYFTVLVPLTCRSVYMQIGHGNSYPLLVQIAKYGKLQSQCWCLNMYVLRMVCVCVWWDFPWCDLRDPNEPKPKVIVITMAKA